MTKTSNQVAIAGILVVALGLSSYFFTNQRRNAEKDQQADADTSQPAETVRTSNGNPVLHLQPATQTRIGLRTQILKSEKQKPELTAYGQLEEDPARTFILRAPISGTLHYAPGRDWPSMGEHLADRAVVGTIQPRFTPSERISLTSQLTTAKSDLIAGTAAVSAARSAYERTKVLNADNKNVSDQVLQDAAARLQAEEARYRAANQTVQQIQASLQSADPAGSRQLVVERGGEVVELIAQPGESIEPGAPILRVAKLNQLLARIDIPVGEHVPASVTTAKIVPVGFESQPIVARRIAVALASGSAVPGQAQGEAFLFRLDNITFGLRPGVAVTAYIDSVGPLQEGVIIPQSAVVRFQGSGFAYVQTASNEFLRKQVSLDSPTGGGYFTTRNFQPGDRVVVVGAESLLSEEFKAQISDED